MDSSYFAVLILVLVTVSAARSSNTRERSYLKALTRQFYNVNNDDVETSLILREIAEMAAVNRKYRSATNCGPRYISNRIGSCQSSAGSGMGGDDFFKK